MTLTKTEAWTQVRNFLSAVDTFYKYTNENSSNYNDKEDTLLQSLEGPHTKSIVDHFGTLRGTMISTYNGFAPKLMDLYKSLAQYGYSLEVQGRDDRSILVALADAMNTASETILNRAMTYASITTGGSNVGNGTIYRCTKDVHGNNLEIAQSGTIRIDVTRDKNTGVAAGAEEITFRGNGVVARDIIEKGDSTNERLASVKIAPERDIIIDGDFRGIKSGALTADEQNNWTLSDKDDFEKDTTVFYRYQKGQESKLNGSGASLVAKSNTNNVSFFQYVARNNARLRQDVPYLLVCRVRIDNAATDGTVTLRLGTQTATLDVGAMAANTWVDVVLGIDEKGYFENFKENWLSPDNQDLGVRIGINVDSRETAGKIFFSNMELREGILFNGVYYFPMLGSNSGGSKDALVGDTWSFADTAADTGRMQLHNAQLLNFSLPHASSSPTYADIA